MANPDEQKRRFTRLKLNSAIRYQVRGSPEYDSAVMDNISLGGVAVTHNKYLPRLTPLMLEFNVLARSLTPIGQVVWSSPLPHSDKYRLGIEFIEFGMKEKEFLSDFIEMKTSNL